MWDTEKIEGKRQTSSPCFRLFTILRKLSHTVEEAPAMSGCLLFARNDAASAGVRQLVQTVFISVCTTDALGVWKAVAYVMG